MNLLQTPGEASSRLIRAIPVFNVLSAGAESSPPRKANAKFVFNPGQITESHSNLFRSSSSFSKVDHAVSVMESLEQMWKNEIACDFIIKVGEELYSVHKALLVANSDYFKAMIASKMKEGIEGFVDMKGVEARAIKCCLEYIYTGKTFFTASNVVEVLRASSILQLGKLEKVCYEFLRKNLNSESCILTLETAQLYDHKELENLSREFFTSHFSWVTASTSFCEMTKDEALQYILEFGANDDSNWQASKNWIEHEIEVRGEEVNEFFNMLDLTQFPSSYLLNETWKAEYFQKCAMCVGHLFQRVFSNVLELSDNINISNCIVLNEMAQMYEHTVHEIHQLIHNFMLKKFAKLTSMADFVKLPEKDVISLFQSPHAVYFSSEKIKWNAALKWINAKPKERTKVLKVLMKSIAFESLPQDFIQDSVRKESLIQKFPDFQKLLLDTVFSKPQPNPIENFVAMLDSSNDLSVLTMDERKWRPLHFSASSENMKITSLNGHLCVLDGKHLHILKGGKWWQTASLVDNPSTSSEILSLKDFIYILDTKRKVYSFYDSLRDSWTMGSNFPVLPFKEYIIVSGRDSLFLLHSAIPFPLDIDSAVFKTVVVPLSMGIVIDQHSSAAFCSGSVYVCGLLSGTRSIAKCDPMTGVWKKISNSPEMSKGKKIKISTVDTKLVAYVTSPAKQLLLEFYDDQLNDWVSFGNALTFPSCGMAKRVIYLCSFRDAKL